jgi:hypothetical protein
VGSEPVLVSGLIDLLMGLCLLWMGMLRGAGCCEVVCWMSVVWLLILEELWQRVVARHALTHTCQ